MAEAASRMALDDRIVAGRTQTTPRDCLERAIVVDVARLPPVPTNSLQRTILEE